MITQIVDGKRIVNKDYLDTYNGDFDTLMSSFLLEMGFELEDEEFNIWKKNKFFKVEIGSNFIECTYMGKSRDHIFESNSRWKEDLCSGCYIKYSHISFNTNLYTLLSSLIEDLRGLWEEHQQRKVLNERKHTTT